MSRFCHCILGAALLLPAASSAEERGFEVTVDGKPAGDFRMKVTALADGSEQVDMAADVKFRTFGIGYSYSSRSTEIWTDGRLRQLDSAVNDDGKKKRVKVESDARGLTVVVNNRPTPCAKTALLATGWRLPPSDQKAFEAVVVDTEDGTQTVARIEYVGDFQAKLPAGAVPGRRYKVTGKDLDAEWVFDGAGRPIHQTMKWDGHTVVLKLTGITK